MSPDLSSRKWSLHHRPGLASWELPPSSLPEDAPAGHGQHLPAGLPGYLAERV